MTGVIHRNIINKTPSIMVPLFKCMIRPIIEYGSFSPNHLKYQHFTNKIDNIPWHMF